MKKKVEILVLGILLPAFVVTVARAQHELKKSASDANGAQHVCQMHSPPPQQQHDHGNAAAAQAASSTSTIKVTPKGYEPSTVRATVGKPVTLTFMRTSDIGCGGDVILADYNLQKALPLGKPVSLTFTPKKAGVVTFTCGMKMMKGKVVVESAKDDTAAAPTGSGTTAPRRAPQQPGRECLIQRTSTDPAAARVVAGTRGTAVARCAEGVSAKSAPSRSALRRTA